jgi:hypothetical protein
MVILSPSYLVQGRDPLHLSVWQHLPGRQVRLCGRRPGRDCPRVLLLHAGKKSERGNAIGANAPYNSLLRRLCIQSS